MAFSKTEVFGSEVFPRPSPLVPRPCFSSPSHAPGGVSSFILPPSSLLFPPRPCALALSTQHHFPRVESPRLATSQWNGSRPY